MWRKRCVKHIEVEPLKVQNCRCSSKYCKLFLTNKVKKKIKIKISRVGLGVGVWRAHQQCDWSLLYLDIYNTECIYILYNNVCIHYKIIYICWVMLKGYCMSTWDFWASENSILSPSKFLDLSVCDTIDAPMHFSLSLHIYTIYMYVHMLLIYVTYIRFSAESVGSLFFSFYFIYSTTLS